MWIRVYIPGRLEGELELAPVTVLLGLPRSGKTTLLRIIYDAVYYAQHHRPPRDLILLVKSVAAREEEWELVSFRDCETCSPKLSVMCSRDGCNFAGGLSARPLFIPTEVELVVKYGYLPSLEPYLEFGNLVNMLRAGVYEKPSCTGGYEAVLANRPESRLVVRGGELYEVVGDMGIEIYNSSTSVAKLGLLEEVFKRGLLNDYTHILLDNPESGLHLVGQAKLALLAHAMANCGKTVVVATHDLVFVDMLTRVEYVNKIVGADIEPADVAIYAIEDGRLKRYETYASYIRDYTPYIYALYGYEVEEKGEDYVAFKT